MRSDFNSQKTLDLSSSGNAGGRKRTEQPAHTYYRLYKDKLQPEIDRDFARQVESISQVAHRNRYLAERLKQESDEVKEIVHNSRLKAGDKTQRVIEWADADEVTADEIERRNTAVNMNECVSAS
jgi:hypothetical protein